MRNRNRGIPFNILLSFSSIVLALLVNVAAATPQVKPNIILINLDDADTDLFSDQTLATRFPHLHELADRSVKFKNVHATTPLCGPSRACLLRAQYAHHCGIRVNRPNVRASYNFDGGMRSYIERGYANNDLSTWMQDAGYHTMQVGKFLHEDTSFTIPEGWDDFYSSVGGKYFETYRITNRDGPGPQAEWLPSGVYRTTAETADTVNLIQKRANADDGKPFFLFLNPFGPHRQQEDSGEMYEPRYANLWPNATIPDSPAYDQEDNSDLSGPLRKMPRFNSSVHAYMAEHYRERLLAMKSVDDMVGQIVATIERLGLEDNTYIFVTSDNGFSMGHHRVISKGLAIDRATNIPLLVAGPGVVTGESSHLLAHIDIGPTIVQIAGGSTPSFADGVSFARLIANPQDPIGIRDNVLIENFELRTMFGKERQFSSTGLRLKNAIYVEWASGGREYFNLANDPEQLNNIYANLPEETRASFAAMLRQVKTSAPAQAGFRKPYFDLDLLPYPWVLEGIAESTVSTRHVKLAVRDLSTGKFWDGESWTNSFRQVTAKLDQPNGMLTTWKYNLDFGDQRPVGLVKAWAWGLDWTPSFEPPDAVIFRLGNLEPRVSLVSPLYAQRFQNVANLYGAAISGDKEDLEEVELRIRDVESSDYWTGSDFVETPFDLPVQRSENNWNHSAALPKGTYRVTVQGVDTDGKRFDVTHRLFHVD